jgi:hypothetical protein
MSLDPVANKVKCFELTFLASTCIKIDINSPAVRAVLRFQFVEGCAVVDGHHSEIHPYAVDCTVEATPLLVVIVVCAPWITWATVTNATTDMAGVSTLCLSANADTE